MPTTTSERIVWTQFTKRKNWEMIKAKLEMIKGSTVVFKLLPIWEWKSLTETSQLYSRCTGTMKAKSTQMLPSHLHRATPIFKNYLHSNIQGFYRCKLPHFAKDLSTNRWSHLLPKWCRPKCKFLRQPRSAETRILKSRRKFNQHSNLFPSESEYHH